MRCATALRRVLGTCPSLDAAQSRSVLGTSGQADKRGSRAICSDVDASGLRSHRCGHVSRDEISVGRKRQTERRPGGTDEN